MFGFLHPIRGLFVTIVLQNMEQRPTDGVLHSFMTFRQDVMTKLEINMIVFYLYKPVPSAKLYVRRGH